MQIKANWQQSFVKKALEALFVDKERFEVKKTRIGQFFSRFYLPYLTEILLFLAILIYWYEGFITKYVNFIGRDWLALLLVLLALLFVKKERLIFGKAQVWYLVFLLFLATSGLLAIFRDINPNLVFRGWLLFAQFGLVFYASPGLKKGKKYLNLLLILSSPLSLMGIYQYLVHKPTSQLWLSPGENLTRAFAFFGSPNVLGVLMVLMVILALGLFVKEKKYIYLIPAFLSFAVVIFTFSRSAWLSLAVAIIFALVVYNYRLLVLAPLLLLALLAPSVRNRFSISFSQGYLLDSTLDGRIWAWINGFFIFKKYPVFGTGPGTYGGKLAANYASPVYLEGVQNGYTALYFTDDQYLEILVQFGVLGLVSFIGFIISSLIVLIKRFLKKKDIMALTSATAFISFLVSGLFANVLDFGAVAVPMALILGVSFSED
jgi:O-antigen ligase